MRLPRRMYWLADRIVGIVSDCEFGFLNKSDTVLVRRCVCAVEGCGLLADGQTCSQITTRGYAVTVRTF